MTETDRYIKCLWEENLEIEIGHLHKAAELLKKYEGKQWNEVIPDGSFPAPLCLHENISYVREVLKNTVQFTGHREEYERIEKLSDSADFFKFQKILLPDTNMVPSHNVICAHINRMGYDYRFQVAENPVSELRCRTCDNTSVGRVKDAADSRDFRCN